MRPRRETAKTSDAQDEPAPKKLSFRQQQRLDALPGEIERLTDEIARLEDFLSDPDLYATAPLKFEKASTALSERQDLLSAAETEWLELAELAETLSAD